MKQRGSSNLNHLRDRYRKRRLVQSNDQKDLSSVVPKIKLVQSKREPYFALLQEKRRQNETIDKTNKSSRTQHSFFKHTFQDMNKRYMYKFNKLFKQSFLPQASTSKKKPKQASPVDNLVQHRTENEIKFQRRTIRFDPSSISQILNKNMKRPSVSQRSSFLKRNELFRRLNESKQKKSKSKFIPLGSDL